MVLKMITNEDEMLQAIPVRISGEGKDAEWGVAIVSVPAAEEGEVVNVATRGGGKWNTTIIECVGENMYRTSGRPPEIDKPKNGKKSRRASGNSKPKDGGDDMPSTLKELDESSKASKDSKKGSKDSKKDSDQSDQSTGKIHAQESMLPREDGPSRKTRTRCGRRIKASWSVIRSLPTWKKAKKGAEEGSLQTVLVGFERRANRPAVFLGYNIIRVYMYGILYIHI